MARTQTDALRLALQRFPGPEHKPTSVPSVITLEEILTRAQNKFCRRKLPWYRRLFKGDRNAL